MLNRGFSVSDSMSFAHVVLSQPCQCAENIDNISGKVAILVTFSRDFGHI